MTDRRPRLLLAMLKHETNTFSPVVTDLERFRAWGLHEGTEAVLAAYRGTNHPIAAFIAMAEREGFAIVAPVAAEAMPGGPVTRAAYDHLTGLILKALETEGPFAAALLDLHGAMVPEGLDDGEGPLLAAMRAIAPDLPIGVTFDMHANISRATVANATAINGYKHYPHTDMAAVGDELAAVMLRTLRGEIRPVMAWAPAGILAQTLRMGTADEPMGTAQAMTREEEARPGILLASVFGGFPMADIPEIGLSVVVVADGDRALADASRDRLLAFARAQREQWLYRHEPLDQALDRASRWNDHPVILLDHADNVGSGGTSDVMGVIKAVLEKGLDGVAVATVWDPEAVAAMHRAGVGAALTLPLGGKTAMPALGLPGRPLTLTGAVEALSDGSWTVTGPMYTGTRVTAGPTAVFRVAGLRIVVTSFHHEPWDTGIFTHIGIDPAAQKFLLLKSRIHYRAGFQPIGRHTITLDGEGVTTSDNRLLRYTRLPAGIYPIHG